MYQDSNEVNEASLMLGGLKTEVFIYGLLDILLNIDFGFMAVCFFLSLSLAPPSLHSGKCVQFLLHFSSSCSLFSPRTSKHYYGNGKVKVKQV